MSTDIHWNGLICALFAWLFKITSMIADNISAIIAMIAAILACICSVMAIRYYYIAFKAQDSARRKADLEIEKTKEEICQKCYVGDRPSTCAREGDGDKNQKCKRIL